MTNIECSPICNDNNIHNIFVTNQTNETQERRNLKKRIHTRSANELIMHGLLPVIQSNSSVSNNLNINI